MTAAISPDRKKKGFRHRTFVPWPEEKMRVPEAFLNCVGFLVEPIPLQGIGVTYELEGTAFLVSIESTTAPFHLHEYWVTAKHLIDRLRGRDIDILVNWKGGISKNVPRFTSKKWFFHPTDDSVDVAVSHFLRTDEDILSIPREMFIDREEMKAKDIGEGDEVFMVGMFELASGSKRNSPLVRHGNIAMLPDEQVQVDGKFRDVYLTEARSIGGISGSPVLVRRTVSIPVAAEIGKPPVMLHGLDGEFHLLGMVYGHWDIKESELNSPRIIQDRQRGVNLGISTITPSSKILEVLNQPFLAEQRLIVDENWRKAFSGETVQVIRCDASPDPAVS